MTTRPGDLGETRDLLRERVRESGRVLLSAGDVQAALAIDGKLLRQLGDEGRIEYVAKGAKARAYTIEAVLRFIAQGGVVGGTVEGEATCRSTSRPARNTTASTSSCEVVAFTARPGGLRGRPRSRPSAPRRPGRGKP